jgi:predicted kinase
MFALVLTGPPGSGKSEVASSLHDSLGVQDVDTALVEVDALERSHPPIDRERSISHLAMLTRSYRDLGSDLLVVTATLEDDQHREAALAAIEADGTMLVRLEADPETMRNRLLEGLPELLNASRRLAASMEDLRGVDLVLSTEGEQPGAVAARLEKALRSSWPGE